MGKRRGIRRREERQGGQGAPPFPPPPKGPRGEKSGARMTTRGGQRGKTGKVRTTGQPAGGPRAAAGTHAAMIPSWRGQRRRGVRTIGQIGQAGRRGAGEARVTGGGMGGRGEERERGGEAAADARAPAAHQRRPLAQAAAGVEKGPRRKAHAPSGRRARQSRACDGGIRPRRARGTQEAPRGPAASGGCADPVW